MKHKGSICEFRDERVADLRRVYGRLLMESRDINTSIEIYQKVVESRANKFYVSYERALAVMRKLLAGERSILDGMKSLKRQMFEEIEVRVRRELEGPRQPSLKSAVLKVINGGAPCFYLTARTAQEYVNRTIRVSRSRKRIKINNMENMKGIRCGATEEGMERLWNMLPEDGALVPLAGVKDMGVALPEGWKKVLGWHRPPAGSEVLLYTTHEGMLEGLYPATGGRDLLGEVGEVESMATTGNVVAVSGSSGMQYFIHDGVEYRNLGSRPPFVPINFALSEERSGEDEYTATTVIEEGGKYLAGEPLEGAPGGDGRRTAEGMRRAKGELADHVMGLVNEAMRRSVDERGHFALPFFVRYAWRLTDGTHAWHSAPILMCPSMHAPEVRFRGEFKDGNAEVTSAVRLRSCRLDYRIGAFDEERMGAWRDLLEGIDIYVSAPFHMYDVSGEVEGSWVPSPLFGEYDGTFKGLGEGTWREHEYGEAGNAANAARVWKLPDNPAFEREMWTNQLFYRIATIDYADIATGDAFAPVKLEEKDLTLLRQHECLPDDFRSHAVMYASAMLDYNSRLHIGGVRMRVPKPLPLDVSVQYSDESPEREVDTTVELRKGGRRVTTYSRMKMSGNEPRWLWYPDPDATAMIIGTRRYPLQRHEGLYGAWWMGGAVSETEAVPPQESRPLPLPGRVMVTGVDSPFVFPARGVALAGGAEVMALAAATLPMSQGQFGQYPVYAFTAEGVWALDIGSEGWIVSARPLVRDVPLHRRAVANTAGGAMFLTVRGLLSLSGASCRCLSESLEAVGGIEPESLPMGERIMQRKGLSMPRPDFSGFITAGAVPVFSHRHGRITVYSPWSDEAYVLSCRSGEWGMTAMSLAWSDGDTAVDREGKLVRLYAGETGWGGFITRSRTVGTPPMKAFVRRITADVGGDAAGSIIAAWVSDSGTGWRMHKGAYGTSLFTPTGSGVRGVKVMVLTQGVVKGLSVVTKDQTSR